MVTYECISERLSKQECIPVGYIPPAHWPYLVVSYACPPPRKNHACPSPERTMHAPQKKPCMPPLEKPRMPPQEQPHMPPGATMHAPQKKPCMPLLPRKNTHAPPRKNHAHIPPGATMHVPLSNHARHPLCGQTDTCKNITFANFLCGR